MSFSLNSKFSTATAAAAATTTNGLSSPAATSNEDY